ncbi:hypothetical protein E8E11_001542 [Didymella keratinophila]|nr:hypothetical protein E8E11_001542 [Didymella keratinophila]
MADQATLKLLANYSITAFLLSTGALALLSPTTMASLFGMPIADNTFASGFVQCMGGRNLTFGIISAIFVSKRDLKAAATMATMLALDGAAFWGCGGDSICERVDVIVGVFGMLKFMREELD